MENSNYNAFLGILISESNQIIGINPDYSTTSVSKEDFSHNISISEDGTLWALSLEPDPDGGGSKMYYSTSPNQWHEITSHHQGAIKIAGGDGSNCFYINGEGHISKMQPDGTSNKYFTERAVLDIGAGGGKLWAIYGPNEDGDIPKLHFSGWTPPFNFIEFKKSSSDVMPTSLSVSSRGDCYGVIYARPWFYRHDGGNVGAVAEGVDDITLQISWKEATFILTTDCNENGNLIMQMGAPGSHSYDYGSINLRGIKVISTFYKKDS